MAVLQRRDLPKGATLPILQIRPWRYKKIKSCISGHTVVEQESISRPRIHSHYLPPDPYDNPGGEEVRNEAQRWQRTCFRSHSLLVAEPSVLGERWDAVEKNGEEEGGQGGREGTCVCAKLRGQEGDSRRGGPQPLAAS